MYVEGAGCACRLPRLFSFVFLHGWLYTVLLYHVSSVRRVLVELQEGMKKRDLFKSLQPSCIVRTSDGVTSLNDDDVDYQESREVESSFKYRGESSLIS